MIPLPTILEYIRKRKSIQKQMLVAYLEMSEPQFDRIRKVGLINNDDIIDRWASYLEINPNPDYSALHQYDNRIRLIHFLKAHYPWLENPLLQIVSDLIFFSRNNKINTADLNKTVWSEVMPHILNNPSEVSAAIAEIRIRG